MFPKLKLDVAISTRSISHLEHEGLNPAVQPMSCWHKVAYEMCEAVASTPFWHGVHLHAGLAWLLVNLYSAEVGAFDAEVICRQKYHPLSESLQASSLQRLFLQACLWQQ